MASGGTGQPYEYIVMLVTNYKWLSAWLVSIVLLTLCQRPGGAAEPHSPAGLWKTFDDKTHRPRGTVRVFAESGTFSGRIESSFDPADAQERCDKCTGDRKNAPIIGLTILRGLKKADNGKGTGEEGAAEFDHGEILDPETGAVYKCRVTLSASGTRLLLRGYLGISLLGRTQIWERVE